MRKVQISNTYEYVTLSNNVANAASPIATLTVPAGTAYLMKNGTPLLVKLYDSTSTELTGATNLWIAWQAPVGKSQHQAGRTMNYGIFQRISASDQESILTQGRRLIEFDDDEIARYEAGQVSLISGLTADYQLFLMVDGPTAIDHTQANFQFSFEMYVLTTDEYEAAKKKPATIVPAA